MDHIFINPMILATIIQFIVRIIMKSNINKMTE